MDGERDSQLEQHDGPGRRDRRAPLAAPSPGTAATAATDRREVWEKRWREGSEAEFVWHMDEVPPELADLLDHGATLPTGAVVDLGCGGGVATTWLAQRPEPQLRATVGVDIAHGAVAEARRLAGQEGAAASFVVADATSLPFRNGALALVFDRGCLQNVPRQRWSRYFTEVEGALRPGGAHQLFCSKAARSFPPLLSARGLRRRAAWVLGRRGGGPQFLSLALVQGLVSASLRAVELEERPFRTNRGQQRTMIYGLFTKVER